MRGIDRRVAELERAHRQERGGALAVLLSAGKEPEEVERELAALRRRLPAGQMVIILDR